MEKITVPFITGDGVGAEVTPSMRTVVDAALKKAYGGSRTFPESSCIFFIVQIS